MMRNNAYGNSLEAAGRNYVGGLLANCGIRVSKRIGDCVPGGWGIREVLEQEKGKSTDGLICVGHCGYYPGYRFVTDAAQGHECWECYGLAGVPCELGKLRHSRSCTGSKTAHHDGSNGCSRGVFQSETSKGFCIFESIRKARIERENAVFCWVVIQACNEQVEVIRSQDYDCLFLSSGRCRGEPLANGAPFVGGFSWTREFLEDHYKSHRDSHPNRECQEEAWAPHGLSMA